MAKHLCNLDVIRSHYVIGICMAPSISRRPGCFDNTDSCLLPDDITDDKCLKSIRITSLFGCWINTL